eukprot:CAMPEP_0183593152 /NCGR_PEP_ID=MMETSP0371-20130417/169281_1 /TAXON_ID=268820 /ORGANISM="Peridinium aciculiferum, Strain PAER-2" /LENGTH=77 /DNA_ID=CAMNT_0025804737 /DNA_START=65 /DNA_END=295 /DNA_ORIENTATION=-
MRAVDKRVELGFKLHVVLEFPQRVDVHVHVREAYRRHGGRGRHLRKSSDPPPRSARSRARALEQLRDTAHEGEWRHE